MAMNIGGGKGGPTSDINVTPMIDILLVLLIIFMVVQPSMQKGLDVQVPPVEKQEAAPASNPDQIVLEIQPGPSYLLNKMPIPATGLEEQLKTIYAGRNRKVIFVKGTEELAYGDVIAAVDAARGAGVEVVGLVPRSP